MKFTTGVFEIDVDHFDLLVGTTNVNTLALTKDELKIRKALHDVHRSTILHFRREEKLMSRFRCPDLQWHKLEHRALARRLRSLVNTKPLNAEDVVDILENTLQAHIANYDRISAEHIKKIRAGGETR